MNVLFLGNGQLAVRIAQWLRVDQKECVVGAVVHDKLPYKYRDELIEATGVAPSRVFYEYSLDSADVISKIKALGIDVVVSVLFGKILRLPFITAMPTIINLHPGYLPYCRGSTPNVWAIIDDLPAGVTLHTIDSEAIDDGRIIAQVSVPKYNTDNGKSLYDRLIEAAFTLFCEAWPQFKGGNLSYTPPSAACSLVRHNSDFIHLKTLDPSTVLSLGKAIDILRALTFPPTDGYRFKKEGKEYKVTLAVEEVQ